MLTKTKIALAAALILGAIPAAFANDSSAKGGFDTLGNGRSVESSGKNTAVQPSKPMASPEHGIRTEGSASPDVREKKEKKAPTEGDINH